MTEIEVLISNTERTKNVIEDKKRELSEQEKMFKDYREKIKEHLEKVEEWQKDKPKYKELKREEEKLNRLKAESKVIMGSAKFRSFNRLLWPDLKLNFSSSVGSLCHTPVLSVVCCPLYFVCRLCPL